MEQSNLLFLISLFFLQPILNRDIELPSTIPDLMLKKHEDFLIAYGNNKDEYVREFIENRFFVPR